MNERSIVERKSRNLRLYGVLWNEVLWFVYIFRRFRLRLSSGLNLNIFVCSQCKIAVKYKKIFNYLSFEFACESIVDCLYFSSIYHLACLKSFATFPHERFFFGRLLTVIDFDTVYFYSFSYFKHSININCGKIYVQSH